MTTIEEIAELTARRKLIPFLGAGCSKSILNCDWDSLIQDMQAQICSNAEGHLGIAQAYVDKYGKQGLCDFLKPYLYAEHFDEVKGNCYIAVMCSGAHTIYTTNQDNVMELCMQHFGRKLHKVVHLCDLAEAFPDERLYIKFHGDLDDPDSVVFAEKDYYNRLNPDKYFLDIRLKSDLLGRRFLFLGYSFRDPNIQQMFQELQRIADGQLPSSYLIAYDADETFVQQCKEYNINVIIPKELFPNLSIQEAFDMFLGEWNRLTFNKYMINDIDSLFSPHRDVCIRMLSSAECELLEKSMPTMQLSEAIHKFRGIVDAANIPESIQERVANIFFELCRRCKTHEDAMELNGASFNLYLTKGNLKFYQAAHALALANVSKSSGGLPHYHVGMPNGFNRSVGVFVGAISIKLLRNWKRTLCDYFLLVLSSYADYSEQYDSYGTNLAQYCIEQYNYAWEHCKTTLENPLKRQKRLNCPLPQFVSTNYCEIKDNLMKNFPLEFK